MAIRVGVSAAIVRDGKILLVEFADGFGPHFNLPGGGVEDGEGLHEALEREVREETCAIVRVDRLLCVWEYEPRRENSRYGTQQKLGLVFECVLQPGSEPVLPDAADENQIGVRWVPLTDLADVPLLPAISAPLRAALAGAGAQFVGSESAGTGTAGL